MLKRLGLKGKLIVAFVFIAIIGVFTGLVGLRGVRLADADIYEIGVVRVPSLEGLQKMNDAVLSLNRFQLRLLHPSLINDAIKELDRLGVMVAAEQKGYDIYAPLPQTKEEEESWKRFLPFRDKWIQNIRNFSQIMEDVKREMNAGASIDSEKVDTLISKAMSSYVEEREIQRGMDKEMDIIFKINYQVASDSVKESIDNSKLSQMLLIIAMISGFALALLIGYFLAAKISRPIVDIANMGHEIANGNYALDVDYRSGDETGQLADSFRAIIDKMNIALGKVNNAVVRVAAESNHISQTSQSLSSGATESAAALEEITASITQIGAQAKSNAENSSQSSALANNVRGAAEKGNTEMADMLKAIRQVCEDGQKIAKVVKMIDDIAFQTNVLSLNAAVEAARAGKHGRGFTVVADAVRGLANESAAAAKETAALVEGTIKRMDGSLAIAQQTAESLREIVSNSVKASDLISEIAAASNEQAQGVYQIGQGLTQLNQVIQQNSAHSEEAARTAEELSGQAEELHHLVGMFLLKDNGEQGAVYMRSDSGDMLAMAEPPKSAGYLPDKGKKPASDEYVSLDEEEDRY